MGLWELPCREAYGISRQERINLGLLNSNFTLKAIRHGFSFADVNQRLVLNPKDVFSS
jgi:hypothetical protein